MAQGGVGSQHSDRMIHLLKLAERCSKHEGEALRSYCQDCSQHICLECIHEEHKKHDVVPVRKIEEELRHELTGVKPELQEQQKDVRRRKDRLKKDKAAMKQRHQKALDDLRKKQKAELEELEGKENGVNADDQTLEELIKDVSNIRSTTVMTKLTKLKPRVDEALSRGTPEPSLAGKSPTQLRPVVQNALAGAQDGYGENAVAVVAEGLQQLELYAQGETHRKPTHLCPLPKKAYSYEDETVKLIPGQAGQQLATALDIPHPTVCSRGGPNDCWVLTSNGHYTHVWVSLYKQPGNELSEWWLPSSLTVGRESGRGRLTLQRHGPRQRPRRAATHGRALVRREWKLAAQILALGRLWNMWF